MTLVAIIEQDPGFAAELRTAVESAGFHTDWFREARTALEDVGRNAFSLAIIDLDLHGVDPFVVCREASRVIPVIAVTASRHEDVCLRALEAGADDCVTRPFSAREIAARCRNLLRRAGTTSSNDELSVAISAMRVRTGDGTRALSRGEAEILAILASSRGRPLTALELLERLPTHSRVKRGTVESRIKSLRRKLGPGKLLTRGRLGYELAD